MFVIGGGVHRTSELLSVYNWQWNIMDPYPSINNVNSVKIIPYNQTFYVFGGYVNDRITSDILCFNDELSFKNESWSRVGILTSKRVRFSVILNIDKVFVIGGKGKQRHDICELSNTVNCEQDTSIYFEASEEPVLFGVRTDGPCDLKISTYKSKETKELMILSNAIFNEVDHFVPVQKTNYRNDN